MDCQELFAANYMEIANDVDREKVQKSVKILKNGIRQSLHSEPNFSFMWSHTNRPS